MRDAECVTHESSHTRRALTVLQSRSTVDALSATVRAKTAVDPGLNILQ